MTQKVPDDPRLPAELGLMHKRLTDLFRGAATAINALIDKADTPVDAASSVTVGPSPFAYANAVHDGLLVVRGGTVSAIDYARQGAFTPLGVTSGPIPLKAGDSIRITYSVAPTITFIRQ